MEAMRSTWTDSRLDEFKDQVNVNLKELGQRVGHQSSRIDTLQHTMVQAFIALVVIMVTGFMGLAGLILTQI
jgi:tetrahydromethanopterin S-methyltransferase subunit G